MMAIPKAFMLLGLIPGGTLMVLIACLSYFTLSGAGSSGGLGAVGSFDAIGAVVGVLER